MTTENLGRIPSNLAASVAMRDKEGRYLIYGADDGLCPRDLLNGNQALC